MTQAQIISAGIRSAKQDDPVSRRSIQRGDPASESAKPKTAKTKPAWDDRPIRTKVAWLVVLAAVGGMGLGLAESALGHLFWPGMVGLVLLLIVMISFSHVWIGEPIDRLLRQLARVQRNRRANELNKLPTTRGDEIGRIAKAVHEITCSAIRHNNENRALRRTIDHRVTKAVETTCRRLEQLAHRDSMTGLGNRRFLDEELPKLFEAMTEAGDDVICLAIDVDNFKQVNDQLGHATGDDVLKFLADLIRGTVRKDDYPIRLGGDEFVVFMPMCALDRAEQIANQILALFRQSVRMTMPNTIGCDLSIGIASSKRDIFAKGDPQRMEQYEANPGQALIDAADEYLYDAKKTGKGRVAGV